MSRNWKNILVDWKVDTNIQYFGKTGSQQICQIKALYNVMDCQITVKLCQLFDRKTVFNFYSLPEDD